MVYLQPPKGSITNLIVGSTAGDTGDTGDTKEDIGLSPSFADRNSDVLVQTVDGGEHSFA